MNKAKLIELLAGYNDDHEIMIADYDGVPREINMGPRLYEVQKKDAEATADCEELTGRSVVLLGVGNY